MFIQSTRHGASSSSSEVARKGWKGSVQFHAERKEDGTFSLVATSTGNYGKLRGFSSVNGLSSADLVAIAAQLNALAQGGLTSTAAAPEAVEALHAQVKAELDAAEQAAPEAPQAEGEPAEPPVVSEIEQLEA